MHTRAHVHGATGGAALRPLLVLCPFFLPFFRCQPNTPN